MASTLVVVRCAKVRFWRFRSMCGTPFEERHSDFWSSSINAAEFSRPRQPDSMQMFELEGRPTGELRFEFVHGKTAVTTAYARYPLKFVSATRASDGGCSWVYTLGYGGGAVCGDEVTISCSVGGGCTAALTTQGSTKVYKRTARVRNAGALEQEHERAQRASQSLLSRVSRGGLLAVVPDPVTCFKDSSFRQHQRFLLERGSSLALVDWLTSGRMSRGEGWAFSRLESRNEVMVQGASPVGPGPPEQERGWEALVLDSLVLEELPGLSIRERMLGMNVVGVVILLGPRVQGLVSTLLQVEAGKRSRFPPGLEPQRGAHGGGVGAAGEGAGGPSAKKKAASARGGGKTICSVSPLHGGCDAWCRGLVYRFAAERTEDARALLHDLLLPLKGTLGGRAAFSLEGGSS